MKKILVVDCNTRYLNPTRNLLPTLFSKLGEVYFWGPGYNMNPIKAFLKSKNFDLVIFTEYAITMQNPTQKDIESAFQFYKKFFDFEFTKEDLFSFFQAIPEIMDGNFKKVAVLLTLDFQTIEEKTCLFLEENFDLIVGLNKSNWSKNVLEGVQLKKMTQNWWEFINRNDHKILSFFHFISDYEFNWSEVGRRKHELSILGIAYLERKRALQTCYENGLLVKCMPKTLVAMGKILPRIGLNLLANQSFQQFLNSEQRKILNNSQFSYTCGSEIKWPVRKYFEIPAAGAVLLCSEFKGMRDAGFIHGENCMIIDADNIYEIIRKGKKTNNFDKIAKNGRNMIATSHSLSKRSEQLSVAIDKTLDASFCGADWVDGELIYR